MEFALAPPAPARKSPELTQEERLAVKSATKVIEALESDPRLDGFRPGAWWGKGLVLGRHQIPMLEALVQLGTFIRTNRKPPEKPWAYLEDTYQEKEANYYANRAERASAARREPGRREP